MQLDLIAQYNYKKKSGKKRQTKKDEQLVLDGDKSSSTSAHDDTIPDSGSEVSDSMHSSDEEEVDALINCPSAPVDDNVGDDNITVDSIINEDYCEDETVPQLPAIDSKLSELLTKWLRNAPSRDKIKDLFKQCMLPCNVDGLKPVRINDLLYEKLNFHYKVNDQRLRGINTYIARGLGPLISVWDNILKWETALSGEKEKNVVISMSTLQLNDLCLDLSSIRKSMSQGLRLLCTAHSVVLLKRKQQLKSFFDPKFHYLLKHTNPVTEELLGDNVDLRIAESTKLSEAAHKLQVHRPHFHGFQQRGRGLYRQNSGRRPFFHRDNHKRQTAAPSSGNRGNYPHHSKRGCFNYRGHSNVCNNRSFPRRR